MMWNIDGSTLCFCGLNAGTLLLVKGKYCLELNLISDAAGNNLMHGVFLKLSRQRRGVTPEAKKYLLVLEQLRTQSALNIIKD